MQVCLAENLRQFRRERQLTQEQLAEVLGVAVGTVSKWESGSSTPDLALILELADFFGTSVDVLLGYRQQSTSLADTVARLQGQLNARQYDEGRRTAEKAVKRFPNNFEIFYQCALLMQMAALEEKDADAARKAEAWYTRALELIDQNTDPKRSRTGLRNRLADLALDQGEVDRGIALLQQNNVEGLNNARIGQALAQLPGRRAEAVDYLETALLGLFPLLSAICIGYLNAACCDEPAANPADARILMVQTCRFCEALRRPDVPSRVDKYLAVGWAGCAFLSEQQGLREQAVADLAQARLLADRYDAHPVSELELCLVRPGKLRDALPFDDFGPTAAAGVEKLLRENAKEYPRLPALWADAAAAQN